MKFTEILEELKKGVETIGEDNLKKYYFDIVEEEK